ncbi:hypothetical protein B0H11DRAFT_2352530, partial [Mycena galericulata]
AKTRHANEAGTWPGPKHPGGGGGGPSSPKESVCEYCKADGAGRNIILSFDGTSNQYGNRNTNVIELYARMEKDESQLTYYNSGIGTYARPSWRSFQYRKQVVDNHIDLAIAWNFEKAVLAGHTNFRLALSRFVLLGFSRGTYQIRTLAALIDKVGLILPGNEEQIPFAFELYADLKTHSNKGYDEEKSAQFFKDTFSRANVKIHFLGAWDAVSSVGIRSTTTSRGPRVKEVWFAGCHSDIGGGLRVNDQLNNAAVPVLWMGNEAQHAGLKLKASRVWRVLELLPVKRLSYADSTSVIWRPHLSNGRVVKPEQKIHASVAFIKNYQPKAILPPGTKGWQDILEKGSRNELSWTDDLRDILEMDLFDLSNTKALINNASSDNTSFDRLRFLSTTREGAEAIGKVDPVLQLFTVTLNSKEREPMFRQHSAQVLLNLARHDIVRRALSWSEAISALAAVDAAENLSFPQLKTHVVFEIIALLCADGKQHFNFEHQKDLEGFTDHLDNIITHLPDDDPKKSHGIFIFGEWNYILYLRGRAGIEDGVSTFEHYFRRSLQTASKSFPPVRNAAACYLEKSVELYRLGLKVPATTGGPHRTEYLRKLATCLQARFIEIRFRHTDLDEAITLLREALTICDADKNGDRKTHLNHLADALRENVRWMGSKVYGLVY